MNSALLQCNNICLAYDDKIVINQFNLSVFQGDKLVLSGPSGKGKSTILSAILGFVPLKEGNIYYKDKLINQSTIFWLRSELGFLPQDFPFPISVLDFIQLPFQFKSHKNKSFSLEYTKELFDIFLLDEALLQKSMLELSGGEKQRVGLITTLGLKNKFLVLDEPVSSLDSESKNRIIQFLFSQSDLTIISASHDDEWKKACSKIMEM